MLIKIKFIAAGVTPSICAAEPIVSGCDIVNFSTTFFHPLYQFAEVVSVVVFKIMELLVVLIIVTGIEIVIV